MDIRSKSWASDQNNGQIIITEDWSPNKKDRHLLKSGKTVEFGEECIRSGGGGGELLNPEHGRSLGYS